MRGEIEELRRGGVRVVELLRAVVFVWVVVSGDEVVFVVDIVCE